MGSEFIKTKKNCRGIFSSHSFFLTILVITLSRNLLGESHSSDSFFAGMKKFEYEGRKWHAECFQCDECHQQIRDQKFAPTDDRIVCVQCYEHAYAPRCHNCNRVSSHAAL